MHSQGTFIVQIKASRLCKATRQKKPLNHPRIIFSRYHRIRVAIVLVLISILRVRSRSSTKMASIYTIAHALYTARRRCSTVNAIRKRCVLFDSIRQSVIIRRLGWGIQAMSVDNSRIPDAVRGRSVVDFVHCR